MNSLLLLLLACFAAAADVAPRCGAGAGTVPVKCGSHLWASVDCPTVVPRQEKTILFLLGYPYTGTSAVHFLLGANEEVSTLNDPGILGFRKEGWRQPIMVNDVMHGQGLWDMLDEEERWDRDTVLPWDAIRVNYLKAWNASKPILLENSPPEVMHAQELIDTFSPDGDVRFILLARSPCTLRNRKGSWPSGTDALQHLLSVAEAHPRRTFVLRYEDVCTDPERAGAALATWLPGLSLDAIDQAPPKPLPQKSPLSVAEYCAAAVRKWPASPEAVLNGSAVRAFGYAL